VDAPPSPSRPVTAWEITRLALPATASALLNNAFRVIDQYAAGAVSTPAQAAIGSCTFVLIAAYALHLFVAGGVGPLAARAAGARDDRLSAVVVNVALLGAVGTWAVVALVAGFGSEHIAALLGLEGDTASQAAIFLRTLGVLGLPLAIAPSLDALFVARGQTGRMMLLQVSAALGNVLLNHLFILRMGMGVEGAALATVLARLPASAVGVWLVWPAGGIRLVRDGTVGRVVRVGAPVSLNTLAYASVYFLLLRTTISPLGPSVNAALGIGFSALEGVTYPLFLGLSLAVSSVVGRRLGAGEPHEAARAARVGFPLVTGVGVAAGCTFYFGAHALCASFTDDPEVLDNAITYARTLAWSQPWVAWEALAEGVLLGAGASRPVFWLSAPINALRVPFGWLFAFPLGMGASGAWWAINLTSVLKAALKGLAAWRGDWARMRI
jgi:MATE family multidrug resistance protein